jgi:hypothetical protein
LSLWITAFYNRPAFQRKPPAVGANAVIRWWESRRIFFNIVIGCAGLITCILLIVCAVVSEPIVGEAIGLPDGPLLGVFGIFFYALLANLFYTSGSICELLARKITTIEKSASFGLKLFRAGVTFSILLTLSPAVLCWISFAVAVLHGQKHGPPPE